ncbi:methyltransferase family protein [Sphingosinithalassobacter sp. CS137]|uniref:methyltransferase family protein n=1 Tax=Sphingosinithalassobacter sp. CS137 TaxID=2762748 RepID=UPI00165DC38F|nr:isoprenylcysteine carboxylmethyltransferase family protein [Sphingosinithalassobacter sp. CS137]
MRDIDHDSAGIRFPPPLVYLGALLLGLAFGAAVGRPPVPLDSDLTYPIGAFLMIGGFAILLTASGLFRKAGTEMKPWKSSSALVTEGVYRWTRNPMYLGMALAYAGIALMLDSLIALLLLIPVVLVIQTKVIEPEEAYMERRFGDAYRAYRSVVRRWF